MQTNAFEVLLLIARPAAGKSEVIDYLKQLDTRTRLERFHIRDFEEIDDFPMLWTWFEEDALLKKMGHKHLYTDEQGYFKDIYLWDLLIERICLEYEKKIHAHENYHERYTTLIEFSRGCEHGGYRRAFAHLSDTILKKLAVLYIDVSYQESMRKNRRRFNPERPDSILEHALPDEKLVRLYGETDWNELSRDDPHFLSIKERRVPYVVFENEDDVTTGRGEALGARLENCLHRLWEYTQQR